MNFSRISRLKSDATQIRKRPKHGRKHRENKCLQTTPHVCSSLGEHDLSVKKIRHKNQLHGKQVDRKHWNLKHSERERGTLLTRWQKKLTEPLLTYLRRNASMYFDERGCNDRSAAVRTLNALAPRPRRCTWNSY